MTADVTVGGPAGLTTGAPLITHPSLTIPPSMSKSNKWVLGSAALAVAGVVCMFLGTISIAASFLAGGGGGVGGGGGGAEPVKPGFKGDRPVGLYFMTRFWSGTGTLEKQVWYFTPDGTAYRDLDTGFSDADLAAHSDRGTIEVDGDKMVITWADGKTSEGSFERDGRTFTWDMGIFNPVKPFEDGDVLVGAWEGGESLSSGGNYAAVSKSLTFSGDGTFRWSSVSFLRGTTERTEVAGGSEDGTTGTWEADGYSLVLRDASGTEYRRIAFPYDDEKTPANPDWFFFGGTMYRRQ